MRKIVGREVSRAKYWPSSFFPTTSVDEFPLPSTAVKVTAGFAKPYFAKLSGVSLAMVVIFAEAILASRLSILFPSPAASLGFVNLHSSFSFFAESWPEGFFYLQENN